MTEIQPHPFVLRSTDCSECHAPALQPCYPLCALRRALEDLPPLPTTHKASASHRTPPAHGWMWIDELDHGWHFVPAWGHEGWDLGEPPYVIVAHFDSHQLYSIATYIEGDVEVRAFTTRAERNAATDLVAACSWRSGIRGPADLPPPGQPLAPHHCGPADLGRLSRR